MDPGLAVTRPCTRIREWRPSFHRSVPPGSECPAIAHITAPGILGRGALAPDTQHASALISITLSRGRRDVGSGSTPQQAIPDP